jgi:hypothetical protein
MLASEIIRLAVDDYKLIAEKGFIFNGSLLSKSLVRMQAKKIGFELKKSRAWKIRKRIKKDELSNRGVRMSDLMKCAIAGKRLKNSPEWPLQEIDFIDAETAVSFFKSYGFDRLCAYLDLCPDAVRDRLKASGCRVATRQRQKAGLSLRPSQNRRTAYTKRNE